MTEFNAYCTASSHKACFLNISVLVWFSHRCPRRAEPYAILRVPKLRAVVGSLSSSKRLQNSSSSVEGVLSYCPTSFLSIRYHKSLHGLQLRRVWNTIQRGQNSSSSFEISCDNWRIRTEFPRLCRSLLKHWSFDMNQSRACELVHQAPASSGLPAPYFLLPPCR